MTSSTVFVAFSSQFFIAPSWNKGIFFYIIQATGFIYKIGK